MIKDCLAGTLPNESRNFTSESSNVSLSSSFLLYGRNTHYSVTGFVCWLALSNEQSLCSFRTWFVRISRNTAGIILAASGRAILSPCAIVRNASAFRASVYGEKVSFSRVDVLSACVRFLFAWNSALWVAIRRQYNSSTCRADLIACVRAPVIRTFALFETAIINDTLLQQDSLSSLVIRYYRVKVRIYNPYMRIIASRLYSAFNKVICVNCDRVHTPN